MEIDFRINFLFNFHQPFSKYLEEKLLVVINTIVTLELHI